MSRASILRAAVPLLILVLATVLEVGGDAIIRVGLKPHAFSTRAALMMAGALSLYLYGLTVNLAPLDWGRLVGAYVAVFFVVGQVINLIVFGNTPNLPILVGGMLIVAGGVVITVWQR